jgi:hypothetical protein
MQENCGDMFITQRLSSLNCQMIFSMRTSNDRAKLHSRDYATAGQYDCPFSTEISRAKAATMLHVRLRNMLLGRQFTLHHLLMRKVGVVGSMKRQ